MISYQGKMALLWVALMLCYLLGDVLRLMDKGQAAAVIDGKPMDQTMFLLAALMMLVPILMVIVSALLPPAWVKWISLVASLLLFVINASGVLSYERLYDRMLIIVSLGINLLTGLVAFTGS